MSSLQLLVLLVTVVLSPVQACTMIAVGRNATADGSTLVAHTDDAGFGAADLRMVRVPAQDFDETAVRHVYNFQPGYPRLVTTGRGPEYAPKNEHEQLMTPLGQIPQVSHTYGYFDQDYGFMNEVQLSIGESTSGAKTAGWPTDAGPHGYNMFGIGELTKVALERCDSARCAIKTMGDLAVKYGFYSEDSGDPANPGYVSAAETLGLADRYGEVWVFHVLTGPQNASAVWAAQRVLDTHVVVVANGFVIREMDLDDPEHFLASDNVHSFATEMGWWKPEEDEFDFTAVYGASTPNPVRALYMGRRMWRVFDLVAPSLQLDPRLGHYPEYPTYPFSVKPDRRLDVADVTGLLRDYFQDTPYDLSKGLAAGPFGMPMRWDGNEKGVVGGWERPISMYRTVYSFVLQARAHLPDAIGGVAWYGQSSPHASVYVPFSCAQREVPSAYVIGKESEFTPGSAWWAFSFVNNWSMIRFDAISKDIRAHIADLQNWCFTERKTMEHHVTTHADSLTASEVRMYLQERSNRLASNVVDKWWAFAWKLVGKFTDGYITTGEAPEEMEMPGYPAWWLKLTVFSKWPGNTLKLPRVQSLKKQRELFDSRQNASVSVVLQQSAGAPSSTVSITQIAIGAVVGIFVGAFATWLIAVRQGRSAYRPID
uniref:Peptidase n=1 Tax=Peronospora matthiolae TaxID=2874970 RepID=A0AAV1T6B7_9STRA